MSLLNALLLDLGRMDVYIALRSDPSRGTGTKADPYSGNTLTSPPSFSGLTITRSGLTATVTLNHPFLTGDVVTISGASGADAPFNGTFLITNVVPGVKFDYTMLSTPTSSSVSGMSCVMDAYLFDSVMRSLPSNVPVTVHIGPGLFQTRGYSFIRDAVSWRPLSAMHLIGSGMALTTLQLVGATGTNVAYQAVGVPPMGYSFTSLVGFHASEFTVDCNIAGQPSQSLTCAAFFIRGSFTRLYRIRAINFGRQGDSDASPECFVLGICGADFAAPGGTAIIEDQAGCVVEECVVEQPGLNNVKETTCINAFGGDAGLPYPQKGYLPAFHQGAVVRNCHINCEFQVNPVSIASITAPVGDFSTVTTAAPHGLTAGDWVRISGAVLAGALDNAYNGSYLVFAPVTANSFAYKPRNGGASPSVGPDVGSIMWAGRFPSQYVAVASIAKTTSGPSYLVTVGTVTAHFLVPGSTVFLYSGNGGSFGGTSPTGVVVGSVNGVVDRQTFTVLLAYDPGTPPNATQLLSSFIGVTFQGVSIDTGSGAVMEGNLIMNCRFGGPYHDTFSSKDLVVRGNRYRSVVVGVLQVIGNSTYDGVPKSTVTAQVVSGSYITHSGTTATFKAATNHGFSSGQAIHIEGAKVHGGSPAAADTYNGFYAISVLDSLTFTYVMKVDPGIDADGAGSPPTATYDLLPRSAVSGGSSITSVGTLATFQVDSTLPHGFTAGQGVEVRGARISNSEVAAQAYNGFFTIESVPTLTSFTYRMASIPIGGPSVDASPRPTVNALWQVRRCVVELNSFELLPTINGWGQHVGVAFFAYPNVDFAPMPIYREVMIRNNRIRFVDGLTESTPKALGVSLNSVENGAVEQNIVELLTAWPLQHTPLSGGPTVTRIRYFQNTDSDGTLLPGSISGTSSPQPELNDLVEEALALAFL